MKEHCSYSILFWLNKRRNKNEKPVIYLRITINQKRAELSTHISVDTNKWNQTAQRLKSKVPEALSVNRMLDLLQSDVHRHFSTLYANSEVVTVEMVKNSYLGIKEKSKTICEAFEIHNKRFAEKVQAGRMALKTLTRFEITKKKIKSFLKYQYKLSDKALADIKLSFASEFEHYLTVIQNISNNTAMKYIKITKQVLKMAVENEWLTINPLGVFKCTYIEPERERLTMLEIMNLYNKNFLIKRLEEVRDIYVFCCFTGLAYFDVLKLSNDNIEIGIDGEKWISKNRQKTNSIERLPLLPIALAIIKKYTDNAYCINHDCILPVSSNQRFNGYLKEVAEICGIKKHLTSHTARHTFATTVTLENDVPIETVSQMLGHKSIRTTQIYAKITQKKVSNNMNALKKILIEKEATNSSISNGCANLNNT